MTIRQADGFMYSCIQVVWNEQDNSLAIWMKMKESMPIISSTEYKSISCVGASKSLGWPEAKKDQTKTKTCSTSMADPQQVLPLAGVALESQALRDLAGRDNGALDLIWPFQTSSSKPLRATQRGSQKPGLISFFRTLSPAFPLLLKVEFGIFFV